MPILANPKHEAFAQAMANGMKQIDAYEHAGYPRNPSAASQVKARPEVAARIAEIIREKQDMVDREADADLENLPSELNREWVIKQLMTNVQIAQKASAISAANKAIEMLAQVIGINFKQPKGGSASTDDENDSSAPSPEDFDFDKANDALGRMMEVLPSAPAPAAKSET